MRLPEKAFGRMLVRFTGLGVGLFLVCALMGTGPKPKAPQAETGSELAVDGPLVHENLALYVVRGRSRDPRDFITLEEGLAAKTVAVREKGARAGRDEAQVNQLEVENKSDRWLFLQAGDIVEGGKQDRTIGIDVTLAPHSPPQSIDAFCVEHGRWTPKADGLRFSGNTGIVSSNALKISIQGEKNQSRVWEEVANQERAAAGVAGEAVASLSESGTYNAIVDQKKIRGRREAYAKALFPHLRRTGDALGIVVAINGRITAADIYASGALFRKLSGKLLDSYALEAVLNGDAKVRSAGLPSKEAVSAFLKEPSSGKSREEQIGKTMRRSTRETKRVVLYEYRDADSMAAPAAKPVHKNYLAKSEDPQN